MEWVAEVELLALANPRSKEITVVVVSFTLTN